MIKCVTSSLEATYRYIFDNCYDIYKSGLGEGEERPPPAATVTSSTGEEGGGEGGEGGDGEESAAPKKATVSIDPEQFGPDCTKNLDFWFQLIQMLEIAIEEDRTIYTPVLNQFPNELNVGHLSAITMWTEFTKDLQIALSHHERIPIHQRAISSKTYMSMHMFTIQFFNKCVKPILGKSQAMMAAAAATTVANSLQNLTDFYEWFEPFVMSYLDDNDDRTMEQMHGAYDKDKQCGFQKISEHCLWSSSVVDIFGMLTECLQEVILKLQCPILDVQSRYMRRFSLTLTKILLAYSNTVRREFSHYTKDEKV